MRQAIGHVVSIQVSSGTAYLLDATACAGGTQHTRDILKAIVRSNSEVAQRLQHAKLAKLNSVKVHEVFIGEALDEKVVHSIRRSALIAEKSLTCEDLALLGVGK